MASDDELHMREIARRKALWALADLGLGDPRAAETLRLLDDIDRQEQCSSHPSLRFTNADQVLSLVQVTQSPGGTLIVRDVDIPQPWRERFLCANRGSTRLNEGAFLVDWQKFISEWKAEMLHLEAHRAFAGRF